jgi:hypothetical protein
LFIAGYFKGVKMPLPERMKPASVSRKKVVQLASQAQQILAKIDAGAGPQESELF